jgi:flagellar hook-length control protein FliK
MVAGDVAEEVAGIKSAGASRNTTSASGTTDDEDSTQLGQLLPMLLGMVSQAGAPSASSGSGAAESGSVGDVPGGGGGGATSGPATGLESTLLADISKTLIAADVQKDATLAASTGSGDGAAATSDDRPASATDASFAQLSGVDVAQLGARAAAADATGMRTIHSTVGSSQWPDEIAAQLTMMNTQGLQSADLRLSPASLGPMHVHIDVRDGAATVLFQASDPQTRTALEQALPRLRELFASSGMSLADAGVNREAPRDTRGSRTSSSSAVAPVADVTTVTSVSRAGLGLIDAYA